MIYIGSDHGGFRLKGVLIEHLKSRDIEYTDCGTFSEKSVDYPDIAKDVCQKVIESGAAGILVCGTGVGMSIAANKVKGIRAVVASDTLSVKMSRRHNDANVLCLGQRVLGNDLAVLLLDEFIDGEFEGERHRRRVELIHGMEDDDTEGARA